MPEIEVAQQMPAFTPAPTARTAPLSTGAGNSGGGSSNGGGAAKQPRTAQTGEQRSTQTPPAPTKTAVNPTIDLSGKPVTPLGTDPKLDGTINFADLERPSAPAPKKAAEPKPEPAEPAEPTEPAAEPAEPINPFAVQDEKPTVADPSKRSYDDLSPEDLALAKKLPNNLYRTFTERLKKFNADMQAKDAEIAEAKKAAADASGKFIYEDPNAFRIDPEYAKLENDYSLISFEQEFYTKQLAKIAAGESFQYIEGYRDGQPIVKEVPAPADGRVDFSAQAQVQRALNDLAAQGQNIQRSAAALQERYKTAASEVEAHYTEAEKRFFPNMAPDKLPADEKRVYDTVIETLPRYERTRKSARMQALAAVVVFRLNKQLHATRAENERLNRLVNNTKAAAPITQNLAAPTNQQPAGVIRFADIE